MGAALSRGAVYSMTLQSEETNARSAREGYPIIGGVGLRAYIYWCLVLASINVVTGISALRGSGLSHRAFLSGSGSGSGCGTIARNVSTVLLFSGNRNKSSEIHTLLVANSKSAEDAPDGAGTTTTPWPRRAGVWP